MEKRDIFGRQVHVGSQEEFDALPDDAKPQLYLVQRVEDFDLDRIGEPLRSRIRRTLCERCRKPCYYDPEFLQPELTIICLPCADKLGQLPARGFATKRAVDDVMKSMRRDR